MSHNKPSIDYIYESDEEYVPSEESSFIYKKIDFIQYGQAQIEQQHYGPSHFRTSINQLQTSKNTSETILIHHDLMNDDFQSPSSLKRHSSVYAMIGEKDQDLSQSIFSNSNSRSDSDFSSSGIEALTQKITSKRKSNKNTKKPQQRVFKQIKSQCSSDSISRPHRNTSSQIRRGKKSQSKTQKFIYFCTQFHYSKNFNQYLKKKIIQKTEKFENYINSTPSEKINTLEEIIAQIGQYKMAIHYKVQQSIFMANFNTIEKNLIQELFWKVIQRTYKTRLELEKKYIEISEEEVNPERKRFFDEKGESEFNAIFGKILAEEPFASVLRACKFEVLLQEAMQKMSRKQAF